MKRGAKNSLSAIQKHINRNYRRWFKRYSNIEGVHIGYKKVKGKVIPGQYSIVFHVSRKHKKPKKIIPRDLSIKISGNKKLRIPTDVIESGPLELNAIKLGDSTENQVMQFLGTIGFYFTTPRGTYLCSNMHVLAPNFLNDNRIFYDARRGDEPQIIELFDDTITAEASLITAKFDGIDIGFARINNPSLIERTIRSVGPLRGVFSLNQSNSAGARLQFFGAVSGLMPGGLIELGAVKATNFQNIFMTNLIKIQRTTQDGDSGGPLFDQRNRVVGIILGRDKEASYALHIDDIIRFFQSSRL